MVYKWNYGTIDGLYKSILFEQMIHYGPMEMIFYALFIDDLQMELCKNGEKGDGFCSERIKMIELEWERNMNLQMFFHGVQLIYRWNYGFIDGMEMYRWSLMIYKWLLMDYRWKYGFIDGMEMYRWMVVVYRRYMDGTVASQMGWRCIDGF